MSSILDIAKNMSIKHNVTFNVYDEITGQLVQRHEGHNAATNSMLQGIGHYLLGDGVLNQGSDFLEHWIPKYISLGTMGLYNQEIELDDTKPDYMLPTGIGYSWSASPEENFKHYMNHTPGFGADGYDPHTNPGYNAADKQDYNREYLGLGPVFNDRVDPVVYTETIVTTSSTQRQFAVNHVIKSIKCVKVNGVIRRGNITTTGNKFTLPYPAPRYGSTIEISYVPADSSKKLTTNCELISNTFPRAKISYRKMVPEEYAELPKTIDIIFSAMISTGAMKQFREEGKQYVLITEAGLWSRNNWPTVDGKIDYDAGDNGLLAGYRIYPPNESQQDMSIEENRTILRQQILRVGYNQVVQVVWKVQLGNVGELVNYIREPIIWKGFNDE